MAGQQLSPETAKWLNLLRESPSFVLLEDGDDGIAVRSMSSIPEDSGLCWVSATVTTTQRLDFEAVLIVDTGAGGELCGGYVWSERWIPLNDLASVAGLDSHSVYPLDYTLRVPLQVDHFR